MIPELEEEGDGHLELMDRPFNPSLINIENKLLNIDLIIKRLSQEKPEIDLYPDFQRKDNLWDATKQSRLIESILIRFPLPAFYFDGSNKNKWLVVDGLQRLSSIRNFAINKTLKLTNLEFLTQLEGMGFDNLDRDLQRLIEETQIVAYIINPGTPDDVKFNIFKRINTAGLVLNPQEIRHAMYQGIPAQFVTGLANMEEFKKATNYTIQSNRMLDKYLVNRFFAFFLLGRKEYHANLDSFMGEAMSRLYKLSEVEKMDCKHRFARSMQTNYDVFGIRAFRKQTTNSGLKPINRALFDVFSVVFAQQDETGCQKLVEQKEEVEAAFVELLDKDKYFEAAISSSTNAKKKVHYRFDKVNELVSNVLKT